MIPSDSSALLDRSDGASSPEMNLDHLYHFDDLLDLEAASSSSPLHSPLRGPASPSYSRSNAVHMEIQENAKLPTFTLSVDRTNSGLPRRVTSAVYSPDTRRDIDEMVRLSEQDFSLTEVFLKSSDRSSRNMNYSSAGALMSSIGKLIGDVSVEDTKMPSVESSKVVETSKAPSARTLGTAFSTQAPISQDQSRFAYGRPYQLPIPKSLETSFPPLPSSKNVTASAVSTAAAIVQLPQGEEVVPNDLPLLDDTSEPAVPKLPQYRPPYAPSLPGDAAPLYHSNASHAKARANPTASIVQATLRRSQFGFGGSHIVPSTVQPPTTKKNKNLLQQPLPLSISPTMNSGAAYERKKQRAKDSRVKLNEAIENLSIAINLAGSQSKQRSTQLKSLTINDNDRKQTLDSMNECVKTAESVKKWDRPSFVDSAATLMQNLNTQCEVLMREVLKLRCEVAKIPKQAEDDLVGDEQSPAKRRKITTTFGLNEQEAMHEVTPGNPVMDVFSSIPMLLDIAKFLDKTSLLRCQCISKSIRDFGVFHNDAVWLQSSLIARFGMFNVRQWQDILEDNSTSLSLYQKMDAANVRPHSTKEGSLLLGEGRMQGKVSAWVSMVERSNGETCRSVKVEGKVEYTSLPVVELRYLIQNTGCSDLIIKENVFSVDASTRRRGEEWTEINWDDRFQKTLINLDGSPWSQQLENDFVLCRLRLYESVIVVVHVNAKGCSTMTKFQRRANFTKLLVNFNGTTLPLVVPFFREGG